MAFGDFAKRFGSLMLAALFLLTTVAFSALIFWQTRQQEEQDRTNEAIQQAINDANNNEGDGTMLQGTKLENFTPTEEPVTELEIIDINEGDGEEVRAGATVTAHYTGAYVVNGEIFQSSKDTGQPIPFSLNGVISGWTEGVPGMKVGGIRRLIIPAEKAYGAAPAGYVPGSTDTPLGPLVFDIELVAVEQ